MTPTTSPEPPIEEEPPVTPEPPIEEEPPVTPQPLEEHRYSLVDDILLSCIPPVSIALNLIVLFKRCAA